jgi:hypothetical protein
MKRQTGHPDVEALANFRAGLVEGIRGRQIAAHVARCERCAQLSDQLSAVTWALASAPLPSLPDAVERRIGAAIAAEAATRQVASLAAGSGADPSAAASPEPAGPAAAQPRHTRRWSPRRALGSASPRLRPSPVRVLVPVAACLLLAGLGYLLSVPGASRTPPSAGSAAAQPSVSASGKGPIIRGPRRAISPTSGIEPALGGNSAAFLVTVSSTRYRKPTLRAQVSSQLAKQALAPSVGPAPAITGMHGSESNGNSPGNQAGGSASRSNTTLVPSGSLVGCVMHLTGDVRPALVQLATYQGKQAYVIAVQDQVWVVHLSCTAARPTLITSVALAPAG